MGDAPAKTFELKISFLGGEQLAYSTKEYVMAWLSVEGIDSFVEGTIDGLDIEHDYARAPEDDPFMELGGSRAPLLIYKYEKETLVELKARLELEFGESVEAEIAALDTKEWQEGWKESFKPIYTEQFVIYPPWELIDSSKKLHEVCIEPGMAFGTGQHATTILCLEMLETIFSELPEDPLTADIGTGTGVLAIAAHKLGVKRIFATDIDQDAVKATSENVVRNAVTLDVAKGSVPSKKGDGYQLVFANILAYVLEEILPDIARVMATDGYLIMSGILEEQHQAMVKRATGLGLKVHATESKNGWVAICLVKAT